MKTILLVDSDVVGYRSACAAERTVYTVVDEGVPDISFASHKEAVEYARLNGSEHVGITRRKNVEDVSHAYHNANSLVEKIRARLDHSSVEHYLTGGSNFRHDIWTIQKYKGNRDAVERPAHLPAVRDHLQRKYGAVVVAGMEADDQLGIRATELAQGGSVPVIVSVDKDLKMIPALHYNFVTDVLEDVDDDKASHNFYTQLLTGDRTDWIKGVEGMGPAGAAKILAGIGSPDARLRAVRDAYHYRYPTGYPRADGTMMKVDDAIEENARLLWIKRSYEEPLWSLKNPLH